MQPRNRIGPVCAIGGAISLFIGTWMHPMNSDPNVAVAAFSEYAAADTWVTGHLMQLLGVTLMTAALLLLLRRLSDGSAAEYVVLATAGAIAGLATAAALQAVDGVALKVMVDKWAASASTEKPIFGVAAAALVGSPRADRREAAVRSSLHKRVQAALGEYRPHRGSQASPLRDTLERRIEASI